MRRPIIYARGRKQWLRRARGNGTFRWLLALAALTFGNVLMTPEASGQTPPGSAGDVRATFLTCSATSPQIRFSWNAPASAGTLNPANDPAAIRDYTIWGDSTGAAGWANLGTATATETSKDLTVDPYWQRSVNDVSTFYVETENTADSTSLSTGAWVVPYPAPAAPLPPGGVNRVQLPIGYVKGGQPTITWVAPAASGTTASDGTYPAGGAWVAHTDQRYRIERYDAASVWQATFFSNTPTFSDTTSTLTQDAYYYYAIYQQSDCASDHVGASGARPHGVSTAGTRLETDFFQYRPPTVANTPTIRVDSASTTVAYLTVERGEAVLNGPVTKIHVYSNKTGSTSVDTATFEGASLDFTNNTYEITGLSQNTVYEFRATAENLEGESSPASTTGTTLAGKPTIRTSPAPTANVVDVVLHISPHADDGGAEVTSVQVYSRDLSSGGQPWVLAKSFMGGFPANRLFTVPKLKADNPYSFRATVVNAQGESADSDPVSVATIVASAPTAPTEGAKTTSSVTINWTDVTLADGYRVRYRKKALTDNDWIEKPDGGAVITEAETYTATGLDDDIAYLFQVRVVYGEVPDTVFSPWSQSLEVTTTALAATVPQSAPSTVTGTPTQTTVTITWARVPDSDAGTGATAIKAYQVQGSTTEFSSDAYTETKTTTELGVTVPVADGRSYTHSNLTAGHTWYYRVRAVNNRTSDPVDAKGPWSEVQRVQLQGGFPEAPSLSADVISARQIDLSWTVPNQGSFPITGYEVQSARGGSPPTNDAGWTDLTSGDATFRMFEHTALTPSTQYHYRVRAANQIGGGAWSAVVSRTTRAIAGVDLPAAVENLRLVTENDKLLVKWEPPRSGTAPFTYRLQYYRNGAWDTPGIGGISATSGEIPGAVAGTTYRVRVRAENIAGHGPWPPGLGYVEGRKGTPPGAPTGLAAERAGAVINLRWQAPSGSPTHYVIQFRINDDADWKDLERNVIGTTYAHRGTIGANRYRYRVAAVSLNGQGAWSSTVNVPATGRAVIPGRVENLDASTIGQGIELTWNAPTSGTAPFRYEVQVQSGGNWPATGVTLPTGTTSYTIAAGGQARTYRVRAFNDAGQGPWAPGDAGGTYTPENVPATPASFTANRVGTTITLTWSASTGALGYRIEWKENDVAQPTITPAATATTYERTGVNPTARYEFRIAAINAGGQSAWSPWIVILPQGAPSKPRNLTATRDEVGTTITLNWQAPTEGTVTGYRIQEKVGAGSFATIVTNTDQTSYERPNRDKDSRYQYRVAAIAAGGVLSDWSDVADVPADADPPGAVVDLRAGRRHPNIILEWSAPDDNGAAITGYKVEYRIGAVGEWSLLRANTNTARTAYTHEAVRRDTEYQYRIYAINAEGEGPVSNTASSPTDLTTPTAPRSLLAERAGTAIRLSWTAPDDDGGRPVTAYKVEYAEDDGGWKTLEERAPNTTWTHRNVSRDIRYRYRIRAINEIGTGPPSNVVNVSTNITTPGAPLDVEATFANGDVRITWAAPTDDGGRAISGYRIQYRKHGNSAWQVLEDDTGSPTQLSYTHKGVESGTEYEYRVAAINSVGVGEWSAISNATTPGTPGPPTLAASGGEYEIGLRWDPPVSDGGSAITGYRIDVSEDAGLTWFMLAEVGAHVRGYTHENLSHGEERTYRVRARNRVGFGRYSNVVTASTDEKLVPGPPRLQASAGKTEVELRWEAPTDDGGSEITGYRLEVSEDAGTTWFLLAEVGAHVRGHKHQNLPPGVTRDYRVRANNEIGSGAWSNVVTATTDVQPAFPPRHLQATTVGQQIELTWLEPLYAGGGTIQGYRIEMSVDSRRWSLVVNGVTSTSYLVSVLEPDERRYFRVAAINEAGIGQWSEIVEGTTEPDVPDPPRIASAIAISSTQISVAWNAPRFTGGRNTPLLGYKIESHSGGDWVVVYENTRSLETTFVHGGREPGTEYFYRISAINRVGVSDPSGVVSARTHPIVPTAPHGVTVHAEGADRLRVRWQPPRYDGGGQITGYQIEANRDGTWKVIKANTRSTRVDYLHLGLDPAETVSYRVAAINEAGMGAPSEPGTGTTHATVPDPPISLRAEPNGADRIDLEWLPPEYTGGTVLTGYRIEVSTDRQSWRVLVRNSNHLGTTYSHRGLAPASTRHYRVSAINEAGASRPSLTASATTDAVVPGAPDGLTAIARDHETVDLEWDAPSFTGGTRITGYRIDVSENEGRSWESLEVNTNDARTTYTHSNLEPATVYHYRVYAYNRIGIGPSSPVAIVRTDARRPDPPLNLTAEPVRPDQINLAWDPPEYDGGGEIIGYEVEWAEHPEDGFEVIATTKRSEWSHEGLEPGRTHYYRVRAYNEAGLSDPSNMAEATTDDTADRIERLNRSILPRFASTVASGIVRSVSDRMDAIANHHTGTLRIASVPTIARGGLDALNGAEASRSFGARLSAWGNMEKTRMSSISGGTLRWEGDVLSVYSGSDVRLVDGLYLGLSASHATSRFEVTDLAWDTETEGRYRAGMASVTPYIGWLPMSNVSLWTAGSYGLGEIEVEEGVAEIRSSSATMMTLASGLVGRLTSSEFGGLSLKVEGWLSRVDVKKAYDFNAVSLNLRRVRTALEWTRMNTLEGGHQFTMLANAGLRHDFHADSITNHTGFEFGGGGGYSSPSRRLRFTVTGRMLVTTDADYNEWGIGGGVHLEPPPEGGLAIRAEPSYGSHLSGVEQLWTNGVPSLSNERLFASPLTVEYQRAGPFPYVRTDGHRTAIGTSWKGVSIEGLTGREPGMGLKGNWTF